MSLNDTMKHIQNFFGLFMSMKLPFFSIDTLFHLGSLNKDLASNNSYEGNALSASTCPEAWQSIARLGGAQCYQLSKPGALFLDIQALLNNSSLEKRLLKYGKEQGLIEFKEVYEISTVDCETDKIMTSRHTSYEEATSEMDEDGTLSMKKDWVETPLLIERTNQKRVLSANDPRVLLGSAYAEHLAQQGFEVDGVFYDQAYAPERLSAPAFGIIPSKIDSFSKASVPMPKDVSNVRSVGKDKLISLSSPKTPDHGHQSDISP